MESTLNFLETIQLSISFGGLKALKEVSFQVGKGEILGLIGPNGAGKTTLINLLTGFLRPQDGQVRFKGENITGFAPFSIASRGILRTFQSITLFPHLTVLQNVLTGFHSKTRSGLLGSIFHTSDFRKEEKDSQDRAFELLKKMELEKQSDVLSDSLPYGDQRKLGIAIALAGGPELLLLDEPAAGMNPDESIRLMEIIQGLKRSGLTILLVEHDMKVVMGISERIVVLNHGEKIAEGTPRQVSQNEEVIRVYLGRGSFLKSGGVAS